MSDTPIPTPAVTPQVTQATVPDGQPAPQVIQVMQAAPQPAPIAQGMDETVEGGYYMIDGSPVDSEGRPVKKRK